jgi:predicted nucleic acid-binding protein
VKIYFDPSLLVALYLPERRTRKLREWLAEVRTPIGLNVWQELEFKNAARQKVRRGEADEGDLARTFRIFDDDCLHG